jgi:hypothetical protein
MSHHHHAAGAPAAETQAPATATEPNEADRLLGGVPVGEMIVHSTAGEARDNDDAIIPNEADMLLNQAFDIVSDDEIRSTYPDRLMEPLVTDFESLALSDNNEEEMADLTAAQTTDLIQAIHRDHLLNEIDAHASGVSLQGIDGMISPSSLLSNDEFKHLQNPMPVVNEDGSTIPTGEVLQPGPMLEPEDQVAIMRFMQGEIKDDELTEKQKEVLVSMLLREGGGFKTKPGQTPLEAASEFFGQMRRMNQQNPVLFGRRVRLKHRTSKTRDKKKSKKKR